MGAAATDIAARRQTDPVSLRRLVDGDLNSITMKALEKARERRYASVSDLAADIQRHMEHRPVLASPPGRLYRARKFLRRHRLAALGTAAGLVFLVLSGVTVWSLSHRDSATRPKLTDKDTIVLADFDNKTGDPVFDDTLRQGLSVELQQSPFLSLISDRQVQQTLALMGQPKEARLTSEIAQQICERTASAAVLEGSIARVGSQYVLGLRAKNCNTGNILDQEQAVAARREDVLNSLSQIARKFRTRVGESLATVEKHSTPLAEATTPSLEALKAYSTGMKVVVSSGSAAAIPFFRRAVEIDPKFAMAHANLGLSYSAIGESVLSAESTTKAWQLRDRVSDREKFFIDFTYDRQVTGNLEKAYQTLELWLQTYPRGEQPNPQGLLGGLSTHGTGRFERAIEASQKGIAADPDFALAYGSLASSYFFTRPLPRSGEHASARLRTQAGNARFSGAPIQHRGAKGRPGADGPGSRLWPGASAERNTGWLTRRLSLWLVPAAYRPPGGHRAAPWIWPCKRGNARRQRVTGPHERCGKPFAGMLPKEKGTPWRRSSFPRAGTSNTPPALPWLFRETLLDRRRSPAIWKSASRKIRL